MRKPVTLAATAAALVVGTVVLAGCGSQPSATGAQTLPSLPTSPVAANPTPSVPVTPATPSPSATATPTTPQPLFATPEAAMAAMAKAFNDGDTAALRKVTTPESRKQLYDMWPNPVNLRLSRCQKDPGNHGYVCFFPHTPPKGMDPSAVPEATMLVEPAARPGWYMSELLECG
jgi:hypothetical protein